MLLSALDSKSFRTQRLLKRVRNMHNRLFKYKKPVLSVILLYDIGMKMDMTQLLDLGGTIPVVCQLRLRL